ncbi:MAG TPA: methylmalonyl-CoA mutase family protein, partial [Thermomicrobiales bacterium]|nr:methylmalonyl-CoA mutase family protein [Thermomicrobiales bacterium]
EQGGAVAAIERGFVQNAIADNAYRRELAQERGETIVVGVNRYADEAATSVPIQRIDAAAAERQIARVTAYKHAQDRAAVDAALATVADAARGEANLLPPMKAALQAGATLGQIAGVLRAIFGEHRPLA